MDEQDNLIIKTKVRNKKQYETMLFDYKTTPLTDFRVGRLWEPREATKYKEKVGCLAIWKDPLKDTHTLTDWRNGKIRFDLFIKPKEIVRTDPRKIQEYQEMPEDAGRADAQRTRPRLVMTPAVNMDDIENPKTREILVEDIYTSTTAAALQEAVKPYFRVAAPLPGTNAKSQPLALPKVNPPVVPEEWRMDSVSWDNRQRRCYCDPTREFWLAQPLSKCRACDETAVVQKHRDAMLLAKRQQ